MKSRFALITCLLTSGVGLFGCSEDSPTTPSADPDAGKVEGTYENREETGANLGAGTDGRELASTEQDSGVASPNAPATSADDARIESTGASSTSGNAQGLDGNSSSAGGDPKASNNGDTSKPDSGVDTAAEDQEPASQKPDGGSPEPLAALEIDWKTTEDQVNSTPIELATLLVPVDYSTPDGAQLELALARLKADPAERQGVMMFNPGGPGAGEVADASTWLQELSSLFPTMDIVLMDNRGVGLSTPLECLTLDQLEQLVPQSPLDSAGPLEDRLQNNSLYAQVLEAACEQEFGEQLPFFNSENVARDMETIRRALGEEQLNYWGVSYGTLQGALYAKMYPERIRTWILDSPVVRYADGPDLIELTQQSITAYEEQLERFIQTCDSSVTCASYFDGDTRAAYVNLDSQLAAGVTYNGDELHSDMLASVTTTVLRIGTWDYLAAAMAYAQSGDWSLALYLYGVEGFGLDDQDSFNAIQANGIINLLDNRCPEIEMSEALTLGQTLEQEYPLLGPAFSGNLGLCVGVTLQASETPIITENLESSAFLVMSAMNDPATPHANGLSLVEQLNNESKLLSSGIEGHGVGNSTQCSMAAMSAYVQTADLSTVPETCDMTDTASVQRAAKSKGRRLEARPTYVPQLPF